MRLMWILGAAFTLMSSLSTPLSPFPPPPTLDAHDEALRKRSPETLEDLRAIETRVRDVIEKSRLYTVSLRVAGSTLGTGVIISGDGLVLTAGHVSGEPGRRVSLRLDGGRRQRGLTLGVNTRGDMGLVRITDPPVDAQGEPTDEWPHAEVGVSADVLVGDWCVALGHPGGFDRDRGCVARLGRIIDQGRFLRTDCPLVGGDSGGPLFDMQGGVIGIHSRIRSNLTHNYHVPVDAFRANWDRLTNGDSFDEGVGPVLGFSGRDAGSSNGCVVVRVQSGFPADSIGLRPGDVIYEVNGRRIRDLAHIQRVFGAMKVGDRVDLAIKRGIDDLRKSARLAKRP